VAIKVDPSAEKFDLILDPYLDVASRAVLIGALDESVTNALKHGAAKTINVTISLEGAGVDRRVQLVIANDGKEVEQSPKLSGLAVHRQRAQARAGGLELGTGANGQTEVTVWLPAPAPEPVDETGGED
jgi:signal transduction histidine kinase